MTILASPKTRGVQPAAEYTYAWSDHAFDQMNKIITIGDVTLNTMFV